METIAKKVLEIVDAGLSKGMGEPIPGKMCVEAAVCAAYGLPHSDSPPCVGKAVRELKIALNDRFEGGPSERAGLLRRLAIAQLGSVEIDQVEFAIRVTLLVHKVSAYKNWAGNWLSGQDRSRAAAYSAAYSAHADNAADAAANAAAYVAAQAAAFAAAQTAYAAAHTAQTASAAAHTAQTAYAAAHAAVRAANAAGNAASAAASAAVYAAVYTAFAAHTLSKFAEDVVQILVEMKSPGAAYLYLTG